VRARRAFGEAAGDAAAAGDAPVVAAVAVSAFLRPRFPAGEAAGDAATAGDSAAWADDVV
jgi:hypothetical protein